jgi:nucleotide-binding universal stress UspA family protein
VLPKEAQNPSLKNLVEQYATDVLEKLRQSLVAQGVREVHTCCDYGDVAQSIINSAERTGADLVVLYEKHSDTKHLISEVVKKTIRLSSVPVWTTLKGARHEIRKILCPVDCSAASKSALTLALHLATIYEASVRVQNFGASFGKRLACDGNKRQNGIKPYRDGKRNRDGYPKRAVLICNHSRGNPVVRASRRRFGVHRTVFR